ncbi:unnamed protein product [Trifolium pratense]|uniref:Uncharacterized protein n=1 Tax=Trifolium pratense TaxID=57577 RepID=A0ACB0K1E1_TRIPR|nr:unnamed protein product [Trifolium pratense]
MIGMRSALIWMDDLLFDDFKEFINELRSKLYIEGLCYGNFTKKEAVDISEMIRKAFPGDPLPVSSRHVEQVVRLPSMKDSFDRDFLD